MTKTCVKCLNVLDLTFFKTKKNKRKKIDGTDVIYTNIANQCKICDSEQNKTYRENNNEYFVNYRKENKEKIKNIFKEYNKNNKEKLAEYGREYNKNNKEKIAKKRKEYDARESTIERKKQYRINRLDHIRKTNNDYAKKRKINDPSFKLKCNIKVLICNYIKKGYRKTSKTADILGCSYEEFKTYIESKFESWMNWDNYGKYNGELNYGWDIDHIIPISSGVTEQDIIKLNHYTNLQPLCSKVNRYIKKNNVT
jgi:hypothetical protein